MEQQEGVPRVLLGEKVGMSVIQTAFGCQSLDVYVGDFFCGFYLRGLITKTMKQPPFGGGKGKNGFGSLFPSASNIPKSKMVLDSLFVEEIGFQKAWTNPLVGWGGVW